MQTPNTTHLAAVWAVALLTLPAAPTTVHAEDGALDESTFLERTRRLIYEGKRSGEGYFSSDGRLLVFQSERRPENPFYQIYLLDLATGDTREVSTGIGKTTCAFIRPDGSEILFGSTHHDPRSAELQQQELDFRASGQERRYAWDYDPEMDIYTVSMAGGEPRRLTDARGYDAEGAYSPDGEWIVFASTRDAFNRELSDRESNLLEVDPAYFGEIYVMRADGSEQTRLTNVPGYDGGPFFFADGSRIVWRRFSEDGLIADVWSMNPDGSDQRQLTDFGAMSWAPYQHPSGDYILFASNKLGFENFEVFIIDTEGTKEPVRVTYTDRFDGLPVPSPDGRQLVWTSSRHGGDGGQLYIADWNHEAALAALAASPDREASAPPADPRSALESHVTTLASPEFGGRLTGTEGERRAAAYLSEQLVALGAEPLPGEDDLLLDFEFTSGTRDTGSTIRIETEDGAAAFSDQTQIQALGFSDSTEVKGEAVFAGYGIRVPDSQDFGYDSYATLDVSGKIAVVLRYVPEDLEGEARAILNRYSGLRYKALTAREEGAVGLLVLTGPRSPNAGETIPMAFDTAAAGSGVAAASIGGDAANALFAGTGRELEEIQKSFDGGNPHNAGFELPGVRVTLKTEIERERSTARNVVAVLPGGKAESLARPWVVVGAHYDHLGRGRGGNSLARPDEKDAIHLGADDNASGTAAVLEAARQLGELGHDRNIALAFWSGEELGLLGSADFVDDAVIPVDQIAAYVNLDMVGRVRDNRLTVQAVGSSPDWTGLVEAANVPVGFDLGVQTDPYLPTDTSSFNNAGVPTVNLFSGSHEDYHRPTDTADRINYDDLERVARFAALLTRRAANQAEPLEFVKVERTLQQGGSRDTVRAYTGTIPDYASEVEGLLLGGVMEGGPAADAGLQAGDVVVEFAGQTIANIYDYTYALDAVKIDEPIEVVYVRDGQRHTTTLTPRARR
ncbi:MAG: M20/M25/M40 family metallo-hydrolase [Holophagales bacterium]|nr:M20/M25/M40 family metallo-hydrolase [Holophagales bacterium]MYG31252.1 M20/M25/M40 family metallo-hydrolase [Holophagales bacterium]MYI78846.1 M20/M25/M40 family metallo-hydrolase [Holophagales bacterium]